jgi:prophage antirepressor-like protein
VDEEDKTTALIQCTGSNYKSKSIIINESGLYSLILSSKLDRAREFKHWVTSEVLPQIRMTGGYIPTKDADGRQLTDAEIVDRAHGIIGRTLELVNSQNADCLTATQVARLRRCRAVQL